MAAMPLLPAFDQSPRSTIFFTPTSPRSPSSSAASFAFSNQADSSLTTTPRSSLDSLRSSAAAGASARCLCAAPRRGSRRSSLADDIGYSPYPVEKRRRSVVSRTPSAAALGEQHHPSADQLKHSPAVHALNVFTSLAFAESSHQQSTHLGDATLSGAAKAKHEFPLAEAFQDHPTPEAAPSAVPFPPIEEVDDAFKMADWNLVSPLRASCSATPSPSRSVRRVAVPRRSSSITNEAGPARPTTAGAGDGTRRVRPRNVGTVDKGGTLTRSRVRARQLFADAP